jgi:hypothetical protein
MAEKFKSGLRHCARVMMYFGECVEFRTKVTTIDNVPMMKSSIAQRTIVSLAEASKARGSISRALNSPVDPRRKRACNAENARVSVMVECENRSDTFSLGFLCCATTRKSIWNFVNKLNARSRPKAVEPRRASLS